MSTLIELKKRKKTCDECLQSLKKQLTYLCLFWSFSCKVKDVMFFTKVLNYYLKTVWPLNTNKKNIRKLNKSIKTFMPVFKKKINIII